MEGFSLSLLNSSFSDAELMEGEARLLLHLSKTADFPVQAPVLTKDGDLVCTLFGGAPAGLFQWVEGRALAQEEQDLYDLEMGRLSAKICSAAGGFGGKRLSYDRTLVRRMIGELQGAGEFFTKEQTGQCVLALEEIDRVMTELDSRGNGLCCIHADLNSGNLLVTPQGLAPIDFSLSGYGYPQQECGMLCSHLNSETAKQQAVEGYEEISGMKIDRHVIDAFCSFSVLLFITCQYPRFLGEEWFQDCMKRWCSELFLPLCGEKGSSVG